MYKNKGGVERHVSTKNNFAAKYYQQDKILGTMASWSPEFG